MEFVAIASAASLWEMLILTLGNDCSSFSIHIDAAFSDPSVLIFSQYLKSPIELDPPNKIMEKFFILLLVSVNYIS